MSENTKNQKKLADFPFKTPNLTFYDDHWVFLGYELARSKLEVHVVSKVGRLDAGGNSKLVIDSLSSYPKLGARQYVLCGVNHFLYLIRLDKGEIISQEILRSDMDTTAEEWDARDQTKVKGCKSLEILGPYVPVRTGFSLVAYKHNMIL